MKRTELNRALLSNPAEAFVESLREPLVEVCRGIVSDAATHNDAVRLTTRSLGDQDVTIVVAVGTEASDRLRDAVKGLAARTAEWHTDAVTEGMEPDDKEQPR